MTTRWSILLVAACTMTAFGCKPAPVTISETPISITKDEPGFGKQATDGKTVTVDYVILLPDGEELLSQKDFRFQVGTGSVIDGVDEAVNGMRVGGKRRFLCPPHKHWGRKGYGDLVPENVTLTVELSLTKVG